MDNDALVPSLIARIRTLEQSNAAMTDILAGIDLRIEQTRAQLRDEGRAEVILRRALTAAPGMPPRHSHARPRDRHGLRVIPGGMAALTPVAWVLRTRAHKVIGFAAMLAAGTATVAAPSLVPGPAMPARGAIVSPADDMPPRPEFVPQPALAAHHPHYRTSGDGHTAAREEATEEAREIKIPPPPGPSPTVSATPPPSPTASPSPSPSPTITSRGCPGCKQGGD